MHEQEEKIRPDFCSHDTKHDEQLRIDKLILLDTSEVSKGSFIRDVPLDESRLNCGDTSMGCHVLNLVRCVLTTLHNPWQPRPSMPEKGSIN